MRLCEELSTGATRRLACPQLCLFPLACWADSVRLAFTCAPARPCIERSAALHLSTLTQSRRDRCLKPCRIQRTLHEHSRSQTRSPAGREVEVDMDRDVLTDLATGKEFPLKPLGEVRPHCLGMLAAETSL